VLGADGLEFPCRGNYRGSRHVPDLAQLLDSANDHRIQADRPRGPVRIALARDFGRPVIVPASRWQVFGPISLVLEIILRRFALQFAIKKILQRAEKGRRNGRARSNCRIDRCNSLTNQSETGPINDYVVAAHIQIKFIGTRSK